MHPTREAAQAIRDGAIDASAALDAALTNALEHLPTADHEPLKRAVGQVMGGDRPRSAESSDRRTSRS